MIVSFIKGRDNSLQHTKKKYLAKIYVSSTKIYLGF